MSGYAARGAYQGAYTGEDTVVSSAQPYVEPDKSSRTAAIFQGITGLVSSASDFYQRIKYQSRPVFGAPGDPNVYYGGGVSWVPGQSGEPNKLAISGVAGFTPLILIGAVVLFVLFMRK